MLLQELRILEMLPFDQRIVQLYGSCTKDGNILLVLELMQVTFCWCKYPVPTHLLLLLLCIATAVIEPAHIPACHLLYNMQILISGCNTSCESAGIDSTGPLQRLARCSSKLFCVHCMKGIKGAYFAL